MHPGSQGTLAERVRAGGDRPRRVPDAYGVGTIVAEGKQVINIDGRDYLLEKPLRADVALIRGSVTINSAIQPTTGRQEPSIHDGRRR